MEWLFISGLQHNRFRVQGVQIQRLEHNPCVRENAVIIVNFFPEIAFPGEATAGIGINRVTQRNENNAAVAGAGESATCEEDTSHRSIPALGVGDLHGLRYRSEQAVLPVATGGQICSSITMLRE